MTVGRVIVTLYLLASTNGLCPHFATCVVGKESDYRMYARGRAGEIGAGQLLPETAVFLAEEANADPDWLHKVPMPPDPTDLYTNLTLTVYGLIHYPQWWTTVPLCIEEESYVPHRDLRHRFSGLLRRAGRVGPGAGRHDSVAEAVGC